MNFYSMISRSVWGMVIALAIIVSACEKDQLEADKTAVEFKASLSTDGLSWRDGDQLLITYLTVADSSLTANYQYNNTGKQWKAVSEDQVLYAEDVKEIIQIEGFGQSSNPPTGPIYTDQSVKTNYLRTRHLLCVTPKISADKKVLEATMDSRAVHLVLKLTGVPEQAVVTLAGELPVKAYKNVGDGFAVFTTHLKLWHVPGIVMSSDNNEGIVTPGSLFATISYTDKEGASKTLKIYYTITGNETLVRGDQIYLTAAFTTEDAETSATVTKAWTNADPDNQK